MFSKEKSKEFIENMLKDKKGIYNPMFGKIKSKETLAKFRKTVYVYNSDKVLVNYYESIGLAVKYLHISSETLKKYKDTDKSYKNMFFTVYSLQQKNYKNLFFLSKIATIYFTRSVLHAFGLCTF